MKKKTARTIKFHPSVTVIKGQNDTGKSCLVRSLYYSLGAETHQQPTWLEDNVCYLLDFKIDNVKYSILRAEETFGLFDSDKKLIGTYRSVTNELTPKLAELFDYKIQLFDNKKGSSVIPPPAYIYSFFYIDQDSSWNKKFNSFDRLHQLSNWQQPITEYVTGVKPNKYFEEKIASEKLKKQKSEIENELKIQEHVFNKLRDIKGEIVLTYNIKNFETEIEELMKEINHINQGVNRFKSLLTGLYSELSSLENQKQIIEKTVNPNYLRTISTLLMY
jgi:DNA repair ATPase RecN